MHFGFSVYFPPAPPYFIYLLRRLRPSFLAYAFDFRTGDGGTAHTAQDIYHLCGTTTNQRSTDRPLHTHSTPQGESLTQCAPRRPLSHRRAGRHDCTRALPLSRCPSGSVRHGGHVPTRAHGRCSLSHAQYSLAPPGKRCQRREMPTRAHPHPPPSHTHALVPRFLRR